LEYIVAEIAAEVEELVKGLYGGEAGLDEIEEGLRRILFAKGNKLLSAMLSKGAIIGKAEYVRCEKCGGIKELQSYSSKSYQTLFGEVKVERPYYYCRRCHTSEVPYDRKIGMVGRQSSMALIRSVSRCSADKPFEEAAEMLEELTGVRISAKSSQTISEDIGARMGLEIERDREEIISGGEGKKSNVSPERLYISADGTRVCTGAGWKEVKVGAVYETKEARNELGEPEIKARGISYLSSFTDCHRFGEYLWSEAYQRSVEKAKEVIFISDGGVWLWEIQRTHFPKAVGILDWYHASEHVWGLGKELYGEGTPECLKWVNEQLDLLYGGKAEEFIGNLKGLKFRKKKKASVLKEIGYFESNRERMRYDEYRKKGYQIGSGVIESSCKHVVGARLKGAGMRWSIAGAQNILNLRLYIKNKKWQDFWNRQKVALA
jgi:hypothetical protein